MGVDLPAAFTALRYTLFALLGAWKVQYFSVVEHTFPFSPGSFWAETTYDTFRLLARNCFDGYKKNKVRSYFKGWTSHTLNQGRIRKCTSLWQVSNKHVWWALPSRTSVCRVVFAGDPLIPSSTSRDVQRELKRKRQLSGWRLVRGLHFSSHHLKKYNFSIQERSMDSLSECAANSIHQFSLCYRAKQWEM